VTSDALRTAQDKARANDEIILQAVKELDKRFHDKMEVEQQVLLRVGARGGWGGGGGWVPQGGGWGQAQVGSPGCCVQGATAGTVQDKLSSGCLTLLSASPISLPYPHSLTSGLFWVPWFAVLSLTMSISLFLLPHPHSFSLITHRWPARWMCFRTR
jgi:hypothetical protein